MVDATLLAVRHWLGSVLALISTVHTYAQKR